MLEDNKKQVFDDVEAAYRLQRLRKYLNPESYFLRYPDRPDARIIGLPAHVCGRCSAMPTHVCRRRRRSSRLSTARARDDSERRPNAPAGLLCRGGRLRLPGTNRILVSSDPVRRLYS